MKAKSPPNNFKILPPLVAADWSPELDASINERRDELWGAAAAEMEEKIIYLPITEML